MIISTQVLQEFYVTVTRKLGRPLAAAAAFAATRELADLPVANVDADLVLSAIRCSQDQRISFWDALIVEAARSSGAALLYSEDLAHGQRFGGVTVENPFV